MEIKSITLLRCLACMMVVFSHCLSLSTYVNDYYKVFFFSYFVYYLGRIGVIIFFLLSGYLLTLIHWDDFKQHQSINFLKKRLIRIVPMYYVATTIMFAGYFVFPNLYFDVPISPMTVISSYFFIPLIDNQKFEFLSPILVVGWTLCFDMFFYIIFTIALNFKRSIGLILLSTTIILYIIVGKLGVTTDIRLISRLFAFYTSDIILCFLLGSLLCVLYQYNKLAKLEALPLLLKGILMLVLLPLSYYCYMNTSHFLLYLVCMLFFILFISTESFTSTHLSNNNLFLWLGRASYSIYLTHLIVLPATIAIIHIILPSVKAVFDNSIWSFLYLIIIYLVSCSITGMIFYWVVEKQATMILRKFIFPIRVNKISIC